MKKIIALITALSSLLTGYTSEAQQKSTQKDQSLLWRISGKDLTKTSFLFGTIHMICPGDFLWTEKMKESFKKTDKVCFEMDLDDPSVMMQAAMGLIDQTGKKLKDYFTPEQYVILERYVKDSLGMDIATFEQMKPVALLSMVGTSGVSCQNPVSYEDSLMKIAESQNKEILGLESANEQLEVLGTIPIDTVIAQIMDAIQNNNQNDSDEFNMLVNAYKKQDLPALYALLTSTKDITNSMDMFLDDRNKKWIPRMKDKMGHTSIFFAVGAGHLYGDMGVISLLRKDGYTVEAVK
jgi:uncharacterized protein